MVGFDNHAGWVHKFLVILRNISSIALVSNIFTLNQAFIKGIWENQVLKPFLWVLEANNS